MKTDDLLVRAVTFEDCHQLSGLMKEEVESAQRLARYYIVPEKFDWQGYTQDRLKDRTRKFFVAQSRGNLVGFIELHTRKYPPPVIQPSLLCRFKKRNNRALSMPIDPLKWAVIEACFVSPQCRNKGVGSALVAAGLNWVKQAGVHRVELGVLSANSAVAFWEKLGFDDWRIQMSKELGSL